MPTARLNQVVTTLATIVAWSQELIEEPAKEVNSEDFVKAAEELNMKAQDLLNYSIKFMEEEEAANICRKIKNYTAKLVPKDKAKRADNTMVVDAEDVEYVLSRCLGDCATCLKTGTEVKQCKLRKTLVRMEMIPRSNYRDSCPFQP